MLTKLTEAVIKYEKYEINVKSHKTVRYIGQNVQNQFQFHRNANNFKQARIGT
jgi:hypothetical protein